MSWTVIIASATGNTASPLGLVFGPFPKNTVVNAMRQCKAVLVPEMNMGQISREIKRVNPGATEVFKYNRIDGQLITPIEIFEELQKI